MDVYSVTPWLSEGIGSPAVVPVVVGPLNALVAALPGILLALGTLLITLCKPTTMKRLAQLLWSQKLIVLLVIALGVGTVYGFSALFGKRADAVSEARQADSKDWLAFRGGPDRRAYVPAESAPGKPLEDPAHGKVNWSFADGDINTFYSSPAVVGNRIYVTAALPGYFASKGGIYSIDAATGKLVWAFKGSGYRAAFSSPAVSGKYLVVGEGLHTTLDSRLFCIDIEQSEKKRQGVKLWEYQTTSHMESSPCIVGDRAIFGAGDDGVLCLALEPDKNGNAKKLWQLPGDQYPDCECAPLAYEGKVYYGLGRDRHAIGCVDPKDGKVLWEIETPLPTHTPAIANGKLYIGMGWGDFVNDGESPKVVEGMRNDLKRKGKSPSEIEEAVKAIRGGGELWCVDLADHKVLWKYKTGGAILGAPAVSDRRVYFASRDRFIYCLSADNGQRIRQWDAHTPLVSSPAVADKHVYVTSTDGQLYALDKNTFTLVWNVNLRNQSFSSPTVAHGRVYVGSNGSGLLSLGSPGREKVEPLWAGAMGGPGKSGVIDGSVISTGGVYAWGYSETTSDDGTDAGPGYVVQSPAANLGNAFYLGVTQKDTSGVLALVCDEALAAKPKRQWLAPTKFAVTLSPAATDQQVFFVDGRPGDEGRMLYCVDRQTGGVAWTRPVAASASGEFMLTHKRIYIADTTDGLTCLELSFTLTEAPREAWKAPVGTTVGTPAVQGDRIAVALANPPQAAVLDSGTGAALWTQDLESQPTSGAILAFARTWISSAQGIRGYSLVAGEDAIRIDCGAVQGRIVNDGDRLAIVTAAGELIVADAQTGAVTARIPDVLSTVSPLMVDDVVLYATASALQRYDMRARQPKPALWTRISATWPGKLLTPMIMVDSHIFIGTDKRGFICLKPRKD